MTSSTTFLLLKAQSTYHHQHFLFSGFHSQSKHSNQPSSLPEPPEPPQEDPEKPTHPSRSETSESSSSSQPTFSPTDQPQRPSIPSKPNEIPISKFRSQLTEFSHKKLHPFQTLLQHQLKTKKQQLSNELSLLPNKLSKLTGYGEIDELKLIVSKKETDLKSFRQKALEMKKFYKKAVECRSESVREVNDLLARKASWSDGDLARFTTLVRTDHSNEQEELKAKNLLEEAEAKVDQEFTGLMQAILSRYHEEQVWSDKIRSLSTTFSLSITLINVLVFLAAIVLVEPYKRAKVVEGVENRIMARDEAKTDLMEEALKEVTKQLQETDLKLLTVLERLEKESQVTEIVEEVKEEPMIDYRLIEPTFEEETIEIETTINDVDEFRSTRSMIDQEEVIGREESDGSKEDEKRDGFGMKRWWVKKYEEFQSDPELSKQVEIGAGLSLAVLLIGMIHLYSSK
ncbi:uncharacterized protein MELLADRAFT_87319 [Melampsora larici-populina 98AG31]|uniref:Sensitive to high expression protein 9, mitochondrial n=1 Tax=Melampsora larici-populina (strain 98AG31 / pathotype 3-4-7) TaxID=747676 RepID=F4RMU0_MELLP|nr:uncharacterized protein MELLADRAFT_87319 [Melampsora larici-populina 98AG31]EGG06321.1 hypothetical protein MELLADRAFT_87319 [Melampsora larici-populina 98AG31]